MSEAMPIPDNKIKQSDQAAFWIVDGEYGELKSPIDKHALYGWYKNHYDEVPDIPIRNYLRTMPTVIRTLGARRNPEDRVRVNGGNWMGIVGSDEVDHYVDEGFLCRYEEGSVVYGVRCNELGPKGTGGPEHRMRRWDNHASMGIVHCIEVQWNTNNERT